MGHAIHDAVDVFTDSKAAYDLCHRFTTAKHSRHVDRKMFKMRELRGAGVVKVNHMPGEANPADLFTKILGRQVFEKHRKVVLNLRRAGLTSTTGGLQTTQQTGVWGPL